MVWSRTCAARFYYILLTNISGDQLRDILRNRTDTLESINDIMTDNLKLSSSCQPAKAVQMVPDTFFELVRDRSQLASSPTEQTLVDAVEVPTADPALWEGHVAALAAHSESVHVEIIYHIRYLECSSNQASKAMIPNSVYALAISFAEVSRASTVMAEQRWLTPGTSRRQCS